ncbi:uncharacterized protein LOC144452666 [Glandiceps talaboti]
MMNSKSKMSSIEEIKTSLRESLTSDLEKSVDKVNLKADDILSKADDLTNPRYWYNSHYPRQLVHVMTRSAGNYSLVHNQTENYDRSAYTADEQVSLLQSYRQLENLDREFRKAHQQKAGQQKHKKGKHGRKGKLAWKRRKTWPSRDFNDGPKYVTGHAITMNVVSVSESATENSDNTAQSTERLGMNGEFLDGEEEPSHISIEMEQYRILKSQEQDQHFDSEEVLEAYNRKPSEKVDTLPNIHKSFLPREQRTTKQNEEEETVFPVIQINTRKSDESVGKVKPRKRAHFYRPGQREETEKVQLPMIDDLVRVRELQKTDPSDLSTPDQRKREYVEGWIHRLNKGNSGKTRAKTKRFQSELKRNFDPGIYKAKHGQKEEQKQQNAHTMKDNALVDLPEKYPELAPNEKPTAGMYFHTLRQKSVYSLSLNQMNNQLKRYRQKGQALPRSLSSGSTASDFNAKISKVENKIDSIGNEIGKLYQSTSSLHKIVNREAPKSKSDDISTQGDKKELVIEATPVKVSPTKTDTIEEVRTNGVAEDNEDARVDPGEGPGNVRADDNENQNGVEDKGDKSTDISKEGIANEDKESIKTDAKYVYAKNGLVSRESPDKSKLSVVNLEMAKDTLPGGSQKDFETRSKGSAVSIATTNNKTEDEICDEEGSEQAAERLLDKNILQPGSPTKEPMKKFNKLRPFNEKEVESEYNSKKRSNVSKKTGKDEEITGEEKDKCDDEAEKNVQPVSKNHDQMVENKDDTINKNDVIDKDESLQGGKSEEVDDIAPSNDSKHVNDTSADDGVTNQQKVEESVNGENEAEIGNDITYDDDQNNLPIENNVENGIEDNKENDNTADNKGESDVIKTNDQNRDNSMNVNSVKNESDGQSTN